MRWVVRHKEAPLDTARKLERRSDAMEMATDGVLRGWFRHRPMSWKRRSCAARNVSWSKRAWQAEATLLLFNRSFARKRRWDVTIPAHAVQERNIRSATARRWRGYPPNDIPSGRSLSTISCAALRVAAGKEFLFARKLSTGEFSQRSCGTLNRFNYCVYLLHYHADTRNNLDRTFMLVSVFEIRRLAFACTISRAYVIQ